ncbi:transporter substrate-binding domain-containing protein (plasmid) [Aminobacter sp. SR38]|jgi:polar amino acid transport system substrate-binding protein|uniref:transporter substrate-binding domain-containing protein n=1 Tax=Aminobacter sp. SR38 TaxID=2774562 RepID=UPI00178074A7|nr:transporter substrate-binding domain-containing protein [Aminobacter sp. SR38]QOF75085.1 transporter substrate-binding domain-containing protein [Aminobacter sp. SR38]
MNGNLKKTFLAAGIAVGMTAVTAQAGQLTDRINSGESIRLGFAVQPPSAYPGDDNQPLGFANAITVGVLKKMGYSNIEPIVTDWGGMIPALAANRLDIVTGGMYILGSRCKNVEFSEPIARQYDGFFVLKGNPKHINDYADIKDSNSIMVAAAGYNNIEAAKKVGVPEQNIMVVPGPTEMLAAVRSGRADAGALPFVEVEHIVAENADILDATDPTLMPDWTINYTGIAFRPDDRDFLKKFNVALADYLGTPEMLDAVKDYSYTAQNLPGDKTTAWACENR